MKTGNAPSPDLPDRQKAIEHGVDVSLNDYLLTLTVEERLTLHERAWLGVAELRQIGRQLLGFDPRDIEPDGGARR